MRGGRTTRTIVALALMCGLGVVLAAFGVVTSRRDLALATGPANEAQHRWLLEAADRPDIAQFFKSLSHAQRLQMAEAIAHYDDAALAKLSGLLLADFDAEARAVLQKALARVTTVHPEAVAAQLTQTGGFQQLAVFAALRTLGDRALPPVVAMLDNADARAAAVAYLVAIGDPAATPLLLPRLDDPKPEIRLAAADALGGLHARVAAAPLRAALAKASDADRAALLADLAAIGDPADEPLFAATLDDPARPLAERTAAAQGLGRIGGPEAARLLGRDASANEPVLANAAFAALASVGLPALDAPALPPDLRLRLAAVIPGAEADGVIRSALRTPALRLAAIRNARGRSSLTNDLAALLPADKADGTLAAALVESLAATSEGSQKLESYRDDPDLSGFVLRALGIRR